MVRRVVVVVVLIAICLLLFTGESLAHENLWEKLFGCEGLFPISCPGPLP